MMFPIAVLLLWFWWYELRFGRTTRCATNQISLWTDLAFCFLIYCAVFPERKGFDDAWHPESRPGIASHGVCACRTMKNQAFALRNISSCRAGYSSLVPTVQKIYSTWSGRWLGWKDERKMQTHSLRLGYSGMVEGLRSSSIEPQWEPITSISLLIPLLLGKFCTCSTVTESSPWLGLASNLFSSRLSLVDGRQAIAGSTVDPKSLSVEISTRLIRDEDEKMIKVKYDRSRLDSRHAGAGREVSQCSDV